MPMFQDNVVINQCLKDAIARENRSFSVACGKIRPEVNEELLHPGSRSADNNSSNSEIRTLFYHIDFEKIINFVNS